MRTNHLSTNPRRPFLNCNRRLVLKRVACFLSALYLVVPDVKGDAIQPWGGATAEVTSWRGDPISAQGMNASVSSSGDRKVEYSASNGRAYYTTSWGISGSANVYDSKSKMIGVKDSTNTSVLDSIGSINYEWVPNDPSSKATWTNDSIHIQPLNGQALPDHIKVQFNVNMDLQSPSDYMSFAKMFLYGSVEIGINEKTSQFSFSDNLRSTSHLLEFFDGGITTGQSFYSNDNITGVVSLDLAVNSNGWTDPFSLSLKSVPGASFYDRTSNSLTKEITMGIKDVTTLDGKSLESEGFSISYASDQPLLTPVPEPSSWVVAFTLMTIGIGYRRYSSH